jgi:hypothetical protein
MSLGIVFKGPEGIVLAADSRITITVQQHAIPTSQQPNPPIIITPAFYDNASKLLKVEGQGYLGTVTYGIGTIGIDRPRTAASFLPEFEKDLAAGKSHPQRLSVNEFAKRLGDFFHRQWQAAFMPSGHGDMIFVVGGYNENEAYGRVYELSVPTNPAPTEQNANSFGLTYGGLTDITSRILTGIDPAPLSIIGNLLNLSPSQSAMMSNAIASQRQLRIPYPSLPLQDCVDLSILLIKTTAQLMGYTMDVRGVGGPIDVATVTRIDGFKFVQSKQIHGEGTRP